MCAFNRFSGLDRQALGVGRFAGQKIQRPQSMAPLPQISIERTAGGGGSVSPAPLPRDNAASTYKSLGGLLGFMNRLGEKDSADSLMKKVAEAGKNIMSKTQPEAAPTNGAPNAGLSPLGQANAQAREALQSTGGPASAITNDYLQNLTGMYMNRPGQEALNAASQPSSGQFEAFRQNLGADPNSRSFIGMVGSGNFPITAGSGDLAYPSIFSANGLGDSGIPAMMAQSGPEALSTALPDLNQLGLDLNSLLGGFGFPA